MDGTILIADDDRSIRTVLSQAFTRAGCKVHATSTLETLLRWVEEGLGDLVVTDVMMPDGNGLDMVGRIAATRPDLPIIVISAQNTLTTAVRAEAARVADYLPKPFDLPDLLRRSGLALKSQAGRAEAAPPEPAEAIPLIGSSPAMRAVFRQVARWLDADGPILITGETGTGKTTLARAIHAHSPRRHQTLIQLDPDDLNRPDPAALAHVVGESVVLVDGLGDVTVEGQGRLVRLMERGSPTLRFIMTLKFGQERSLNNDLRDDLAARIRGAVVALPPLRERASDLPQLVQHLARQCGADDEGMVAALHRLGRVPSGELWAGNLHDVKALVMQSLYGDTPLAAGPLSVSGGVSMPHSSDVMPSRHTPRSLREEAATHIQSAFDQGFNSPPEAGWYSHFLAEVEAPLLQLAMQNAAGNQLRCADLLGINRNTLRKKLALHGIRVTRRRRVM